ncbi:partial putative diguanylate cyclase DgcE, partial [Planctomycetaceae bacterium]
RDRPLAQLDHRIQYADGGIGYISVSINIERDEQGHILRYYGANQDITEARLAEEAVRRSEAELSEALQIAKLGYWEYDVEKDLFLFNDQFYSIFHTTAAQHGGYQLPSAYYAEHFVHPDDRGLVGAEIGRSLSSTDRHYNRLLEHRIVYADGSLGYISVNINIDRDEQGRILRVYGANQDITERKRAEVELKETEERFRIIAETTPVPILISSVADGSVLYGNDQLGQMFGIPIAELIGRPTPDFYFDPADRQELLTQLRQAGSLRDYELHVKRADGAPFWVLVSMRTLMFAGQRALFAAFIDITASRQAAEDLRRSEAQLSEALKTARLAYWELDLARQKFIFNDQLYALLHTTAEAEGGYEMDVNAYVGRFIYPEDIPYVGATIAQGLQNPDPTVSTQLEARVVCADGEVRWLATQVSNKVNEAGQPFKAVGTNQDITERKQAEETLRRSEAQLSQALQIAKLAYWEYDVAKDLFFFNDQFYAIFHTTAGREGGYQLSSAQYAQKFVYPDDLPIVGAEIERALNSTDQHYSRQLDHRIQYADGGIGHISVSINIDRDEQGQILRYYGANQDITEAKLAEAEREKLLTEQQKRALQLQTAAEVSRATSSILNLDELLPQAAELVRARFNLYYVGIFLNDEPEHWAVLRAGTGDAGQKMLVRGHRLKIGAASMISQCIVEQQARIALDVGEEAVRFDNPLLPLTRSELALPLVSRGRVIGAVSIQSEQSAAFTSDDIIVLQTMADQIGNAIENARLYEQSTAALQEVDALNRRLTGEGWETYLRRGSSQQVIWAGDDETIAPAPLSAVDEQLSAGQIVVEPAPGDEQQTTVSVPVMLRGQAIGALRIAMPEAAYTDELRATLESLAGHVAQAAENARLLDETQARFARERALTEATDKIRRRPEVEHVLQAAAEELARYLQASAINVRLGASVTATGETGQPG